MSSKTKELIHIAKHIKKTIRPFYSFASFVDKQLENMPFYADITNLIYDLVMSFDEIKDNLMDVFGLEQVKYQIQVGKIEPHFTVKEITKNTLELIKMTDRILSSTNKKHIRKDDLLNVYFRIEEQIILLIVWFNSYLNHMYN